MQISSSPRNERIPWRDSNSALSSISITISIPTPNRKANTNTNLIPIPLPIPIPIPNPISISIPFILGCTGGNAAGKRAFIFKSKQQLINSARHYAHRSNRGASGRQTTGAGGSNRSPPESLATIIRKRSV